MTTITPTRALIIVDVQRDFCEGGALAVAGGNAVAEGVARLLDAQLEIGKGYDLTVASMDWHKPAPDANCGHFALEGDPDYVTSWPIHCVADTDGAALHDALHPVMHGIDNIVWKGHGTQSYSAFEGVTPADRGSHSLLALLRSNGITAIDVVGIATDHCVRATAMDALGTGFDVRILTKLCAGVDKGRSAAALVELARKGADIV